jgi:hypothetical protein
MGIEIYDSSGNRRVGSPVPLGCPAMGGHTGGSGIAAPLYVAGQSNATAVPAAAAAVIGTARAIPFYAPNRKGTIDLIGTQPNAALAASNVRVAIYRNADAVGVNLYPGALAGQFSAAISTATTGLKSEAASINFSPGELLWAVVNADAIVVLRGVALAAMQGNILGLPNGATPGTAFNTHVTVAIAFGAFPATFPAGGVYVAATGVPPAIYVRYSA